MKYSSSDKIKIARIIAGALGVEDFESKSNPEELVNLALRKAKHSALQKDSLHIVKNMIKTAQEAGIAFDVTLIPKSKEPIKESEDNYDVELTPEEQEQDAKMEAELDALSDDDLDGLSDNINDLDDILDCYDDDELHVVDDEGNHAYHIGELQGIEEDVESLTEVLSRSERLRSAVRFKQSKGKRMRKLKIALHKRSTAPQINRRARVAAIKSMKEKIAHKPLSQMTIQDKMRVERIVAKKKATIGKLALRLVPKLRKIENARIHPMTK